jgi:SRSO17 transposase
MMVAELIGDEGSEWTVISQCADSLDHLHLRLAGHFGRPEVRARVRRYLVGLLERVERKNGWQVAEAIGEAGPQGVQRLLNGAAWDAEAVRDELRAYVVEFLGDPQSGVLVVDETGFLKKGSKSCGVASQYSGTAGRTVNQQVGVFLAYATARGCAFIDRALYLPRVWAADRARRAEAGVPPGLSFATKIALAKRMLARAFAAGVPARWVVADCLYGRAHQFRRWLEGRGRPYVVGVLPTQVVQRADGQWAAQRLARSLPAAAWACRSAGTGSQGERLFDWACLELAEEVPAGMRRWLLVRRPLEDPDDPAEWAYYRAYGPCETPVTDLVHVAGRRWCVEDGFAEAKGEVGLDEYEVRRWEAWHRHVTLSLLAHAFLVALRAQARAATGAPKGGTPQRAPCSP